MQTTTGTGQAAAPRGFEDDRYDDFRAKVRDHFGQTVAASPHLFTTDAAYLWEAYLDCAPPGARQERTCNACKAFVDRFGALATITVDGAVHSAIWPHGAPPAYAEASETLGKLVRRSRVTGVFRSSLPVWGAPHTERPVTKPFTHLAVAMTDTRIIWSSVMKTADQEMAERLEQYGMLQRALADFPIEVVRKAYALLTSGHLRRSEKHEGVAKWLLDLHERRAGYVGDSRGRVRENITWLAVAGAPAGFCHVRSGMIGTLLEDVAAELPFETVKRRYEEKMDPLAYMRPQAPPSLGNIAQAEAIIEKLRTAGALERRYATLADVAPGIVWSPEPAVPTEPPKPGEVFGHLKARKAGKPLDAGAPATTITWTKFRDTVLPTAETIEALVPPQPFMVAFVTATNPEAPPMLQWDREDKRNPVSWYCRPGPPRAADWNLRTGDWVPVTAIVLQPTLWDTARDYSHQGAFACLALQGARDKRTDVGLALFPECLRSEYHGIRKTIEAHSNAGRLTGAEQSEVCGIDLRKGQGVNWNVLVRVVSRGIVSSYRLERWD